MTRIDGAGGSVGPVGDGFGMEGAKKVAGPQLRHLPSPGIPSAKQELSLEQKQKLSEASLTIVADRSKGSRSSSQFEVAASAIEHAHNKVGG